MKYKNIHVYMTDTCFVRVLITIIINIEKLIIHYIQI